MSAAQIGSRELGFTFVELMMTLAIMGVLATMVVPVVQHQVKREKERELRSALIEIRQALNSYKLASEQGRVLLKIGDSGYPNRLDELVEGVQDRRSPLNQNLYFLRRLPRDPFHSDTSVPASRTWGTRSYDSPPDDPREGVDVFDVHSLSTEVGSNGIPYRQW